MSKRSEGQARGKYTLEFKLEALRRDKGGQAVAYFLPQAAVNSTGLSNSASPSHDHSFVKIVFLDRLTSGNKPQRRL